MGSALNIVIISRTRRGGTGASHSALALCFLFHGVGLPPAFLCFCFRLSLFQVLLLAFSSWFFFYLDLFILLDLTLLIAWYLIKRLVLVHRCIDLPMGSFFLIHMYLYSLALAVLPVFQATPSPPILSFTAFYLLFLSCISMWHRNGNTDRCSCLPTRRVWAERDLSTDCHEWGEGYSSQSFWKV